MEGIIGLFVNDITRYPGAIIREVKETAEPQGITVEVFDGQHTAAKQAQDLVRFEHESRAQRRCAFAIPEADAISVRDVLTHPNYLVGQRLLQKGTGIITLNHGSEAVVNALRAKFPDLPVGLVAIDNVGFGRAQGRQIRALVPRGGTLLCVLGNPFDSASHDRTAGLKAELGTDFTLEEIDGHWGEQVAETVVFKWIMSPIHRHKPLDGVVAQNDPMGAAARRTLERAGDELNRPELKRIPVLGGDGLPEIGLPWVTQGLLTATICVTLPGKAAVEQLLAFWRDGTPVPAVTRLPVWSHPEISSLRPARAGA